MTHHQPAHGEQNTEEGFQRPQAVLSAALSLQSSHTQQKKKLSPIGTVKSEKSPYAHQPNVDLKGHKPMAATMKTLSGSLNQCFR